VNRETVSIGGQSYVRQSRFTVTGGAACIFNAPSGATSSGRFTLVGHVDWAFKTDSGDQWEFGATESPSWNWHRQGTWSDVVSTFRITYRSGYYTRYRCRDWPSIWGAARAATDQVLAVEKRPYNLANDNCLTRSVEIIKTYGTRPACEVSLP
jgi:hypothetical protein